MLGAGDSRCLMESDTEAAQLLSAGSPDHSGVGLAHARAHARYRTHTHAVYHVISPPHALLWPVRALTCTQTPSTRPFLRTEHSHSQTFIDHSCEQMETGGVVTGRTQSRL